MLKVYRRKLPHWRLEDSTYFVTWRVAQDRSDLEPAERDLVARTLMRFDNARYELLAYVVTNDHVHVVVTPRPGTALEAIVCSWKSYTAHKLPRSPSGRVWQSEYMDRIIRNDAELDRKIEYVLANPFQRWPSLSVYPWVWSRWSED